jgi:hypothetical protein
MATPLLGAFVGNTYPATEALWGDLGDVIGRQPDYAHIFLNHNSWPEFASSVQWALNQWPSHPELIVSVPLIPHGANLSAAASGAYNGWWREAAQKLAAYDRDMIIRTGWEMNGDGWWPWSGVGNPDAFVGAYREFVETFRSVSPDFRFDWTPNMGTQGMNPERLYPGDAYVDYIGMSVYENTQWLGGKSAGERWDYIVNQPHGLDWQRDFAAAHGKEMGYAEYASNFNDGEFVRRMAEWIKSNDVAYHSWWEADDTFNGDLQQHPANLAAYAQAWGGSAGPAPTPSPSPAPTPSPGGSGPDTLVLHLSEDQWNGHAAFAVAVDGVEIARGQSVTASHGAGQSQAFTYRGDWSDGPHQVKVTFLNDAWGGTLSTDRNLYVDGVTFNGNEVAGAEAALRTNGAAGNFAVSGATPTPAPAPSPSPAPTPGGSGPDTLVLRLSEDQWNGHAQFAVTVDGIEIARGQSVTASHASGQSQEFVYRGDWSDGPHQVSVTFLNDAWGGSTSTDRNLYVDGAAFNGREVAGAEGALLWGGAAEAFTVSGGAGPAPTPSPVPLPSPTPGGAGKDTLLLQLSGDAWNGEPRFAVAIDGVEIARGQAVAASHGAGQSQAFRYEGDWGAGAHEVTVTFLNDAWGGSAATDRNLHVDGLAFNGTTYPDAEARLAVTGASASFELRGLGDA